MVEKTKTKAKTKKLMPYMMDSVRKACSINADLSRTRPIYVRTNECNAI